eukprot:1317744-Pyramimonas_sp.AAC.1
MSLAQRIGLAGSPTPEEVERVVRAFHLYNVARAAPEPDPHASEETLDRFFYTLRRATQALVDLSRAPF